MDLHFQSLLTGKYPLTTTHHHHHHTPDTSDESSTTPPPHHHHLLKKPKLEHHPITNYTSYLNHINPYHHPMIMFHQLPDLTSFENLNYPPSLPPFLSHPRKTPTPSSREKQQQKRRTLSEKTRALQKILPWDKKMDMGTLLEETYKYIKFLQAQVKVLELMPVDSSTTGSNFGNNEDDNVSVANVGSGYGTYGYGYYGNVYGGLERLNRQQLLEVIVNSPAAQAILCSRGCCVYSTEQLVMFKDLAEKNYASMYY